jgi:hypothetical protein
VENAIKNRKPRSLIVVLVEDFKTVAECVKRHQQEDQSKMPHLKKAV